MMMILPPFLVVRSRTGSIGICSSRRRRSPVCPQRFWLPHRSILSNASHGDHDDGDGDSCIPRRQRSRDHRQSPPYHRHRFLTNASHGDGTFCIPRRQRSTILGYPQQLFRRSDPQHSCWLHRSILSNASHGDHDDGDGDSCIPRRQRSRVHRQSPPYHRHWFLTNASHGDDDDDGDGTFCIPRRQRSTILGYPQQLFRQSDPQHSCWLRRSILSNASRRGEGCGSDDDDDDDASRILGCQRSRLRLCEQLATCPRWRQPEIFRRWVNLRT